MDFEPSDKTRALMARVAAFMDAHVLSRRAGP